MPEKIGNYDVISVLGRGTFGKVFRVRSIRSPGATGPPKEYAIKVIFEKYSSYISVQREIEVLKKMDHPFILRYIDSFRGYTKSACWCIVTELCEKSLREVLKERTSNGKKPFLESDVMYKLSMIILAVDYLHSRSPLVTHRDIKPDNILLTCFDVIKLGDFGLSKFLDHDTTTTYNGTIEYMAPEVIAQMNPSPEVRSLGYNEKCDIYSIGRLSLEMCNLEVDNERQAKTIPEKYSENLQKLVELMLEEEPLSRPSASAIKNHPILEESMKLVAKRLIAMGYSQAQSSSFSNNSYTSDYYSQTSSSMDDVLSQSITPSIDSKFFQSSVQMLNENAQQELLKILGDGSVHGKCPSNVKINVQSCIYSKNKKIVYATDGKSIQGFTWRNGGLNLKLWIPNKGQQLFKSLALGQSKTQSEDVLLVSVGVGEDAKKQVLRLSGSKLEQEDELKMDHIAENSAFWEMASSLDGKILFVHPSFTNFIYVHVTGVFKEKIDIAMMEIPKGTAQMQLVGDKLVLGNSWDQTVNVYDFVLDEINCKLERINPAGPFPAHWGTFGALRINSDPNEIYIITKTGGTVVSAFRYGDTRIEPFQNVDIKTFLTPLQAVVHEMDQGANLCLLLIGKDKNGFLCAVEVKEKRRPAADLPKSKNPPEGLTAYPKGKTKVSTKPSPHQHCLIL